MRVTIVALLILLFLGCGKKYWDEHSKPIKSGVVHVTTR